MLWRHCLSQIVDWLYWLENTLCPFMEINQYDAFLWDDRCNSRNHLNCLASLWSWCFQGVFCDSCRTHVHGSATIIFYTINFFNKLTCFSLINKSFLKPTYLSRFIHNEIAKRNWPCAIHAFWKICFYNVWSFLFLVLYLFYWHATY